MKKRTDFAGLLERFFTGRLMQQRRASPDTIASYRDTFRLLLGFAQQRLKKAPSALTLEDLDAPFIGTFLHHLENERGNSPRTRNARLAAIRGFFKYAALQEPQHSALIQRVLAIPSKRHQRVQVAFLTPVEVEALLAIPDQTTWAGRRDRTMLLVAVQTGLRVSELIGLRCQDAILSNGAHVRCQGKGRKDRCTPLRKDTVTALRRWIRERNCQESEPLFPNARGGRLSRDGVEYLLAKHIAGAKKKCPSLEKKRVSPHVLRHTAAMDLLQHGVDRTVIALWLGHETLDTVQVYVHADMKIKEEALAKTKPLNTHGGRYQPGDELLAFLKGL